MVDPDPTVREPMRRAIERAGGTVTEAASLAEAEALLDDRFDGVIVDHKLPDGDGFDLLASVYARTPGAHVVVSSDMNGDLGPASEPAGSSSGGGGRGDGGGPRRNRRRGPR